MAVDCLTQGCTNCHQMLGTLDRRWEPCSSLYRRFAECVQAAAVVLYCTVCCVEWGGCVQLDLLKILKLSITYLHAHLLITYLLTYLLNYLLTYSLTPYSKVLLEKLTGSQLVKKFPAFYGTRRFITALTSACHLSLSWASSIQSTPPHPISWRSILILSSHLRLGLPSGLFPSGFPTKTLYTPLPSPIRATCPAHPILLDFITRTIFGEQYRSLSSSLCSLVPLRPKYSPQHPILKHP